MPQGISTPDDELELAEVVSTDSVSGKAIATVERAPLDTTKKNILFIGDSMLERLSPRIAAYADFVIVFLTPLSLLLASST